MSATNPLRVQQRTHAVLLVGRLYLLVRDAYLSPPAQMRQKLLDLRDLQVAADSALVAAGLPSDLRQVHGVRLVESLRACLHRCSRTTTRHERELALLDILSSCAPHGSSLGAPEEALAVDLAGALLPEMAPAKVAKLHHRHRQSLHAISAPLRHVGGDRVDDTLDAVAAMTGGVYGLLRPVALAAALVALSTPRSTPTGASQPAPAGGVLLQHLGSDTPGGHRYVGSALAAQSPSAFAHLLATLDLVVQHRRDLAEPVAERLTDLRADIEATRRADSPAATDCLAVIDIAIKRMRRPRTSPLRLLAAGARRRRVGGLRTA